ncbi:metallophosphoesterase [Granulicella tundricola]|uniref:Metallophosphoesterase n=1 Tax=Granulicella tundricola (strain ATCC BAA-1859 / DSM 23138 / MP5ACTX9) TaxID=1198114 RepID=E8X041_GRATM|nr:metallophosphoesterase [Granulicella tundricola]ADW68937.1 metallophosphoesterase [Granulicella tundricola MP5ACTX9]
MPVVSPASRSQSAPTRHTRRNFLLGSAAAAAGVALYSGEFARHHIDVTQRTFAIRNLPPAFNGFRFVQISDIHLEEFTEEFFLTQVVKRVNALAPDLVLITGDYVTNGIQSTRVSLAAAGRCGALLNALDCPQRFGILGNHDAVLDPFVVRDHLQNNGIPLLVNQFTRIERGGQHLWLGGLDDILSGHPNLDLVMPPSPDAPVIVMAHEPDYVDAIVKHPRGKLVDLVLSGHTHGGQIRLPGLRPFKAALPTMGEIYTEGHYNFGPMQLYVNRGLGTVGLPFRLNCPPEITVATLRPA